MTDTRTDTAATSATVDDPGLEEPSAAPHAVIACDYPDHRTWAGRILHHAPSPAATARVLYELLLTYPKKNRHSAPALDLIVRHPSGWAYLGPDPDTAGPAAGQVKRGQPGRCLCHHPDGNPTQVVIDEALAAFARHEWRQAHNPFTAPANGLPRLIMRDDAKRDPRIAYVFHLRGLQLSVLARDGGTGDFIRAGTIEIVPGVNFDALGPDLDAHAAAIAARTPTDVRRELIAGRLAEAAANLADIAAHHELVQYLVARTMSFDDPALRVDAESALARAAGIGTGELPAFLARASRGEQLRILRLAAHQLAPGNHRAPATDLGAIADRQHAAPAAE
ncbi:hypothetical protein [Catenulispora subtropica]|uniref:Uncharacterized protein n=1 Tax=Catenulispora subtropica TaxID=450798 RepID=A0ABN2RBI5_9ACTN